MSLIQQFIHKLRLYTWFFKTRYTALDYLSESWISIAARWQGELNPMLSYICMFDVLRQADFEGHFLEMGGGYSTILLPNILNMNKVSVTSIDLNPSKYNRILNSLRKRHTFLSTISNIQQVTVSLEEVFFGLEILRTKLVDMERTQVGQALHQFIKSQDDKIHEQILDSIYSSDGQALKNLIKSHENYDSDLKFYQATNTERGTAYCSNLVKKGVTLDAVFFDCGEISSIGEWNILESSIKVGGYALFHDIYYPKSIKNFLIVTYISLSDQWRIVYQDHVSPQGGMVAIKCH